MAERRTVYCKYKFWEEFVNMRPDLSELNDRNIQQMQCWLNFLKFMCKSELFLDIDSNTYKQYCSKDALLKSLWKKSSNGECNIEFLNGDLPNLREIPTDQIDDRLLNSVFLTDLTEVECNGIATGYGVMVLNPKMACNCWHLFSDTGIAIPNENVKNWDFLNSNIRNSQKIAISNAMIIVDNYLLDNCNKSFDHNIIPILDNLLPYSLDEGLIYTISVFTKVDRNSQLCNQLIEKIRNIRKELNFSLNLYNIAKKKKGKDGKEYFACDYFHDRAIVTNYLWIGSGHGFDVFPFDDHTKPTTINVIYPFFQSSVLWTDQAYKNLLKDAKKINETVYHQYRQDYWGNENRANHLIDNRQANKKGKKEEKNKLPPEIFSIKTPKLAGLKVLGKIDPNLLQRKR